ncbi:hypothetical protein PAPHI01_1458 [Pancytospora philotis]|nr:hypothetical protein PAPHI01_1458 [Pancytospora philotis]
MLSVVLWMLEGVVASEPAKKAAARRDCYHSYDRFMQQISPLRKILSMNYPRDRDALRKICKHINRHTKVPQGSTLTEDAFGFITRSILNETSPIKFVREKLRACDSFAEHTLLAYVIRFALDNPSILDGSDGSEVPDANGELQVKGEALLKVLNGQLAAKRTMEPEALFNREDNRRFVYDALVYLFSVHDDGADAVRERFRKMLTAAVTKRKPAGAAAKKTRKDVAEEKKRDLNTFKTIVKLVKEVESAPFRCSTQQYRLQEVVLEVTTSQVDPRAVEFLDAIGLGAGASLLVPQYITTGQRASVSPCFVLRYVQNAIVKEAKDAVWAEDVLFTYFTEAGMTARLRWLHDRPEFARCMSARTLCHVLYYVWKDPGLDLGLYINVGLKDLDEKLFLRTLAGTLMVDSYPGLYLVLIEHCPQSIRGAWAAYIAELSAQNKAFADAAGEEEMDE